MVIIGGGATGLGTAVDAASRGYQTLLLEQVDFGKGTSSRSTKLVHGGVRYLQQGNIPLVMEALKERGRLLKNAPHLVHDLQFIVPNYEWWEAPFYGIGMKVYDLLAGQFGFWGSRVLSKEDVLAHIPAIEQSGLRGGVLYHDGQFDDARLLVNLAQTAEEHGATVLNYARVTSLLKDSNGFVEGVTFEDQETGQSCLAKARCVINATGAFCDAIRKIDDPASETMITPSQGVHIVLPHEFLRGDSAIMAPHTRDGRVMFAIPWHNHVVVGTTDTPIDKPVLEPAPLDSEIDLILETAAAYLSRPPSRSDILSVFTGIRPLVKAGENSNTAAISRSHTIDISSSGLLTITGGKWTTYRKMAEETVDHAIILGALREEPCVTQELKIHGYHTDAANLGPLHMYGANAPALEKLASSDPKLAEPLHPDLDLIPAQIIWAAQNEMARTLEDVLARRTRALFLNQRATLQVAPKAAEILAVALGKSKAWAESQITAFRETAACFAPPGDR